MPETITSQPRLEPRLMPETTRSTGPTSFSNPRMQLSPGVPSTEKAVTRWRISACGSSGEAASSLAAALKRSRAGISRERATTGACRVRDAPTPLCSRSGATTQTSPTWDRAWAAAHRPGA